MITTVTLNTAVDKAYTVDELKKGQVIRVKSCSNTAGGKGLNVAKVIKLCGEEVLATGFIGGHTGAYVEELLKKQEVLSRFIHIPGETRSCINILTADGSSTEFLEPGVPVVPKDICRFLDEFDEIIRESDVVTISGSAPQGVDQDIYAKLIGKIRSAGKKVILDTSGRFLEEGMKAGPTMIKPNMEELEALLGSPITSKEKLITGAIKLQRMGVELVVVSMGGDGALMVTEDEVFYGKPPKIPVVNTVGCGDSMTAAFAVGFSRGMEAKEILRYAIAVSAANAMNIQTGSFRQEDLENVLPQVLVKSAV